MKYKIYCLQRGKYFADGATFHDLEQAREQLISYHCIDSETEEEDRNILMRHSLADIAETHEWEIHDEQGNPVAREILQAVK